MTECVYCTKVRPGIGADCPFCEGEGTYFQPAQMMDGPMSREQTMHRLFELAATWNEMYSCSEEERQAVTDRFRRELVGVLQAMSIYNFDIQTAMVEMIQRLEDE